MTVSRRRKQAVNDYSLYGQVIGKVEKAKYLGVELTKDLSWVSHVHTITAKTNRTSVFPF